MIVKKFKNGNYNVKMEKADFDQESTLINLLWALGDHDCTLFGDEYCLGNAVGVAVDLYDYYTDKLVMIPYFILDDVEKGKTVKLYARNLDEFDREEYDRLEALGEI